MQLGIALDLGSTQPVRPQLDQVCRLLEVAEEAGLTSVWLGESYHRRPEAFHLPAAPMVLAHLSARTSLRLGTAVLLARAHDPARLAYEAALLDQMCCGRLSLGLALGGADLAARFGGARDAGSAGSWFESFVTQLRSAWDIRSENAGVAPLPLQPGGPPLLIGGRTSASAARAAHLGDGYYAATNYSDQLLASQASVYRAACGDGAPGTVAVTRFCLVADDAEQARCLAERHFATALDYYSARNAWLGPAGPVSPQLPLVGTPEDVTAALRGYATAGVTSVQLRVAPLGTPPEIAVRTLQLIGSRVVPDVPQRTTINGDGS